MGSSLSKKLGAAVIAGLTLLAAGQARGQTYNNNGFDFTINPDNSATITGYTLSAAHIVIPSLVIDPQNNSHSVTEIGFAAFDEGYHSTRNLESVVIPSGVTSIGVYAFYNCYNLTSVSIPQTVRFLNYGAFGFCTSLETVNLPAGVTNITDSFWGCGSLRQINFPPSLQFLDDYAFWGCTSLSSVTIPSTINSVGYEAFYGCTSLQKVCFEGDQPVDHGRVFDIDPVTTLYYLNGRSGWGSTFSDKPTMACSQCVGMVTEPSSPGKVDAPVDLPKTTNLVMVIHGWTPFWSIWPFSHDTAMPNLANGIQNRLNLEGKGQDWIVQPYDWRKNSRGFPQSAVRNAERIGEEIAPKIASAHYSNVWLIAHSAGTWMANEIGKRVEGAGGGTTVNATFLDAFTPSTIDFKLRHSDNLYSPETLGAGISLAEHYFHTNDTTVGLGNTLSHAVNYDVTLVQYCVKDRKDDHGWPIRFYELTADDSRWAVGYKNAFNPAILSGTSIVTFYRIFKHFATNEGIHYQNPNAQLKFFIGHALIIRAGPNFRRNTLDY